MADENEKAVVSEDNDQLTDHFVGLPLGTLISQPIIEAARAQARLCEVYLDFLFKLAYEKEGSGSERKTRVINFNLDRPVIDKTTGKVTTHPIKVEAPLLSLVPVPAFVMDEVNVEFTMEVKEQLTVSQTEKEEFGTNISFGGWGFDASISGSVTTESGHERKSDQSAKYTISARAVQQPPAEGMAKLTSLFASLIEPVEINK